MDKKNLDIVRERYWCATFTQKTHEKAAERETALAKRLMLYDIILLSFSLTAVHLLGTKVALTSTFFALCITLYQMGARNASIAEEHKTSAKKLRALKEEYISLIADIMNGAVASKDIPQKRDYLEEKAVGIYDSAPQTTSTDYRKAEKAFNFNNEGASESDRIDQFLPPDLRYKQ